MFILIFPLIHANNNECIAFAKSRNNNKQLLIIITININILKIYLLSKLKNRIVKLLPKTINLDNPLDINC